jgi:intein/homing endonuclease
MMHNKIIEEYMNGESVSRLSVRFSIHRSTVQRILKRNGIVLRERTYVRNCIEDVFSTYTKESCYWAGFIAADGHIRRGRNTLSIKLSAIDYAHLVKFKEFIGTNVDIKYGNSATYCYIDITNPYVVSDLKTNFLIENNKTFTLKFPLIPDEMKSHFIRGFFDGDGSITKTTTITTSFTCASPEFMDELKELIFSLGIRLKSRNRVPPTSSANQVSYSGSNSIKIMEWLYSEANEDILLTRKRDKYEQIKRFIGG